MPRQSRLDRPGALHHIIVRGNERRKIFEDKAELLEIDVSVVWSAGKYRHVVEARGLLCYWAVRDLGLSMTSLAKRLKLSVAAIAQKKENGESGIPENQHIFFDTSLGFSKCFAQQLQHNPENQVPDLFFALRTIESPSRFQSTHGQYIGGSFKSVLFSGSTGTGVVYHRQPESMWSMKSSCYANYC